MDILQTGYELDYFKAELGFKFKFQIQFPEILAKFTIETVLFFTNTKQPAPKYAHALKKLKCRCVQS